MTINESTRGLPVSTSVLTLQHLASVVDRDTRVIQFVGTLPAHVVKSEHPLGVDGFDCVYHNPYYSQCLPRATPTSPTATTTSTPVYYPAGTGLNGRFVAAGKLFWGACADANILSIAVISAAIVRPEFGSLTPENSMKWDATEPSQGSFNFAGADALVNWATQNGKMIRGRTLIWHSQLPSWVSSISDRTTMTSVIQNHISTLAARYKGKIYSWDVVREILNEDGSLRSSVFSNVFGGDGFVNVAFVAARAADPNAKLYIDDYNLDSVNAKVNGLVNLVRKVNSGGTKLIDGCGTQVHIGSGGAGGIQSALATLASAGCEVAITELDIAGGAPSDYVTVLRACLNTPACVSITSMTETSPPGVKPPPFSRPMASESQPITPSSMHSHLQRPRSPLGQGHQSRCRPQREQGYNYNNLWRRHVGYLGSLVEAAVWTRDASFECVVCPLVRTRDHPWCAGVM